MRKRTTRRATPTDHARASLCEYSRGAEFSSCRTWRYSLHRTWRLGPRCNFLCLNPSTADEQTNDPTVERLERRVRKLGYDGLIVTNIFAFRATDPYEMRRAADPVGPENDAAIVAAAEQSEVVICGWGNHGSFMNRGLQVRKLLAPFQEKLYHLTLTQEGQPGHPLFLSYKIRPLHFSLALGISSWDVGGSSGYRGSVL